MVPWKHADKNYNVVPFVGQHERNVNNVFDKWSTMLSLPGANTEVNGLFFNIEYVFECSESLIVPPFAYPGVGVPRQLFIFFAMSQY